MNPIRISLSLGLVFAGIAACVEAFWQVQPAHGWLVQDFLWLVLSEWICFGIVLVPAAYWFATRSEAGVGFRRNTPVLGGAGFGLLLALVGMVSFRFVQSDAAVLKGGPDILLITLDTTRVDALSVFGNKEIKTPNLDLLAARGVRFDQAVATAAQTGPSHLSIMSGKYPFETGVFANATSVNHVQKVAPLLRRAGWSTSAFVSGYPLHPRFGFDDGFQVYDARFDGSWGVVGKHIMRWASASNGRERRGDMTVDQAIKHLEVTQGPLFMWVHLYDPHGPYMGPEPFGGTIMSENQGPTVDASRLPTYWPESEKKDRYVGEIRARYLEEVAWMDAQIGRFLAAYEAKRPGATPLVIVVADHGESYDEHEVFFDHGDDLFEPAMNIPLLVTGGGFPKGMSSSCLVSTVDILPTILEVSGLEAVDTLGHSLKEGLSLSGECRERLVFGSTVGDRSSAPPIHHFIRGDQAKLIRYAPGVAHFYDLVADPQELRPIAAGEYGRPSYYLRELDLRLGAEVEALAPQGGDEVIQGLRQLGYVE